MSRLFIELYLDEDASALVADLLRSRGFSIVTTREAGNLGCSDVQQLEYAASQHKTLLTHNRVDFEMLVRACFAAGKEHPGVIVAVRHSPHEIVRRLLIILNSVTADEMCNQVRYV